MAGPLPGAFDACAGCKRTPNQEHDARKTINSQMLLLLESYQINSIRLSSAVGQHVFEVDHEQIARPILLWSLPNCFSAEHVCHGKCSCAFTKPDPLIECMSPQVLNFFSPGRNILLNPPEMNGLTLQECLYIM